MSEVKNYLKFREERNALNSRLSMISADINQLTEKLEPIEEEALKAEILQTPDFEKKKEGLRESREQIGKLKAELEESRKRLMIINELLPGFRDKAFKELRVQHHKPFENAIRAFAEKIRAAHRAEVELIEVREKALAKFKEIDFNDCPLVLWKPILMRLYEFPNSAREWEEQLGRWKNAGYKIKE